ncbi:V-type ATP synthase subunit E family protein [Methanoregula sp.]|uniref:V-type ATP synthase subunit E n=1 Tax=Methanoregula sp. TaxID=2052170 RepID=UPI0025FF9AE8|nr:V-type ATP synthase subunit E family protein [Methanoregula sp.]
MEESAQERQRELFEKAAKLAGEIRSEAKKQAGEIQEIAIKEAEKSAAIERNKQLYLTKGEIKEQSLRMREKVFDAAFEKATGQLSGLRQDKKYPAIFEQLAREATGAMGGQPFRVHVDKHDEELCKKILAALDIRCEVLTDLQCMGGLVASSPDGLITISNTIESRLERIREHKKLEIHAILAGG